MHGAGGECGFSRRVPLPLALNLTAQALPFHRALPYRCARRYNGRAHFVSAHHPYRLLERLLLHLRFQQPFLYRFLGAPFALPQYPASLLVDARALKCRRRLRCTTVAAAGAATAAGAVVGSVTESFVVALVEAEVSPEADAGAGEDASVVVDFEAGTDEDQL